MTQNGTKPTIRIGDREIPMQQIRMGSARKDGFFTHLSAIRSMHNPPTDAELSALIGVVYATVSESISAPDFAAAIDDLPLADGLRVLQRALPDTMRLAGFTESVVSGEDQSPPVPSTSADSTGS